MLFEIPHATQQEVGAPLGGEGFVGLTQVELQPASDYFPMGSLYNSPTPLHQAPHFETGRPVPIPPATEVQPSHVMSRRERRYAGKRHVCLRCNKVFKRPQELERHARDRHEPRRRCPFCPRKWSRPNKIKAHLIADHAGSLRPETLDEFKALRGRLVVEFLDRLDAESAQHCYSPPNLNVPEPSHTYNAQEAPAVRVVEFLDRFDVEAAQHCYSPPNLNVTEPSHTYNAQEAPDVRVVPNPTPSLPTTLYDDLYIPAACSLFWRSLNYPFHDVFAPHPPQYSMISYA